MSATNDTLVKYHHPHYIAHQRSGDLDSLLGIRYEFRFRPFTGTEPNPNDLPARKQFHSDYNQLSSEDRETLHAEYDLAYEAWQTARFKLRARPAAEKAAPVWDAYLLARKALDDAYAAFDGLPDGQWRAQLLRLTDTRTEVLAAARRWDDVAQELGKIEHDYLRAVGEARWEPFDWLVRDFGINARDWVIEDWGEGGAPLTDLIGWEIERQDARLREVARLIGDNSTSS